MARRLTEAEKKASTYLHPAHLGAFWAGHRIAMSTGEEGFCPYDGTRNSSFRNAWMDGFDLGLRERNRRAMTGVLR